MTELTISAQAIEVEYSFSGASTGPWTFDFEFFALGDVLIHVEADEGTFDYSNGSGATVTGNAVDGGYEGGSVTLDSALTNGTIKIYRSTVVDRSANYPVAGPLDMDTLNTELNKMTAVMQELDAQKNKYISLPDSALSTDPWNLSGRVAGGAGEGSADDDLATLRQVDATGPNYLADDNAENAIGGEGVWNQIYGAANVTIAGNEVTKKFDLITQFFGMIQNRDVNLATFQLRYRYQVHSYQSVSKETNGNYLLRVPGVSILPLHFMDIQQDLDYVNGDGTVSVYIDIKPIGTDSALLYVQWGNLAVNTSKP